MGNEPDALSTATASAAEGGAVDRALGTPSPANSGTAGSTPERLGPWWKQLASGALRLSAFSMPQSIFSDAGAAITAAREVDMSDGSTVQEGHDVSPAAIVDEDLLDWDARIAVPPPRRRGTIRVRLVYKGRAKPPPIADVDQE